MFELLTNLLELHRNQRNPAGRTDFWDLRATARIGAKAFEKVIIIGALTMVTEMLLATLDK